MSSWNALAKGPWPRKLLCRHISLTAAGLETPFSLSRTLLENDQNAFQTKENTYILVLQQGSHCPEGGQLPLHSTTTKHIRRTTFNAWRPEKVLMHHEERRRQKQLQESGRSTRTARHLLPKRSSRWWSQKENELAGRRVNLCNRGRNEIITEEVQGKDWCY